MAPRFPLHATPQGQTMTFAPPRTRPAILRHWGAEPARGGLWRFSVWAPASAHVSVEVAGRRTPLVPRADGFHRATAHAVAGETYRFVVDGSPVTDPAARAQAIPHLCGPSRLIDPEADHHWQHGFQNRPWGEAVLYHLHIGTFTAQGTFAAAIPRLQDIAALGFTALLLMPVSHFPGLRGWGDESALPCAPHPAYGTPAEFRAFVDAAHAQGLMVLMDMHWSHMPPEAPVRHLLPAAFTRDGTPDLTSAPLRLYLIETALLWLSEYRLDGLRLADAGRLSDPGAPHLLTDLAARIHAAGFTRPLHLIAGENPQRPERFTAAEAPLYRRALNSLLTGDGDIPSPLGLLCDALTASYGPAAPVFANQTPASIGARPFGERLTRLADPRAVQVAHALLLSQPATPLVFMGDEAGERAPFHRFADLSPQRAAALRRDRLPPDSPIPDLADLIPDPNDRATFAASRPFRRDAPDAPGWQSLTQGLLQFRCTELLPLFASGPAGLPRARATGPAAFIAEWPFRDGTLRIAASLGTPPDGDQPEFLRPPRLCLGHAGRDPFAFALWLERPRGQKRKSAHPRVTAV